MRLLLDEAMDVRLRHLLVGHDVRTVRYMGWNSKCNGELLLLARDNFDVFITVDQKIPYQQNITEADVAITVLAARTNAMADLLPLIPQVLNALQDLKRGEVVRIETQQQNST